MGRCSKDWTRLVKPALPLLMALTLLATTAEAKRRRATFFPKDLDMEQPGAVELDLRIGALRAGDATNWVVPDLEMDIGVAPRLELGVDAQAGLDPAAGTWQAQDQLWISAKHLLWDAHDAPRRAALGLQHGPRFGVVPGTWAFGYQAVGLLALDGDGGQVVLSAGAFVDPPEITTALRPAGVLIGVDSSLDLSDAWDLAPSVALTGHAEGHVDAVAAVDLELALAPWGTARVGVLGGWQDRGRLIGAAIGYAPRLQLVGRRPRR